MPRFLFWIGAYNVFGSVLLLLCLRNSIADFVLRRATYMVTQPYLHGEFSRLWMLWAASLNLGLGVIMMFAAQWDVQPMRVVTAVSVAGYAIILIAAISASGDPKWGPGIYVGYLLWIAQIAWGGWAFMRG